MRSLDQLLDAMLDDPRHGWSIGTFGAIGEFMRDADEPATRRREGEARTVVTDRGGIRVTPDPAVTVLAFDTLSSDGETWGQSVAFCLPAPDDMTQPGVRALGKDDAALRDQDRGDALFDLGVGLGLVHMALRTADPALIAALTAIEGRSLFGPEGGAVMAHVLRAQPHRVMLSPIGRVEVFSPIPAPGGASPVGPHTHLLPKLLSSGRTHAANAPIPQGLQPVLALHPRSPWRDALGRRIPFDPALDALFEQLLADHGLPADRDVRRAVEHSVAAAVEPQTFPWPQTRRARTQARITLRRLAQRRGGDAVTAWRTLYDRVPEPDAEAALHG